MKRLFTFCKYCFCLFIPALSISSAQVDMIVPGGDWIDTDGKVIVATEGGIIKFRDLYYLWGMDRTANNYEFVGINLYSSSDLKNWKFLNQILKHSSHPDLDNKSIIERAKILCHPTTGKSAMWMHFEGHNAYKTAEVGLATCDSISGNYSFVKHFRPLNIDSRDINVYQDDDGKGYLICTTEGNQSVSLFELDDTYTGIVREIYRGSASNDMECEGHAIIRTGGYYFWLMSWCTGWDFNDNRFFYSKTLNGPWTSGGNVAVSNTHTYESQVGFAVTVRGSAKTSFLYTGDRWSHNNFSMSRIVLLPMEVNGTKLSVNWCDQFDINTQTGEYTIGSKNFIDGVYSIKAMHSGLALGTSGSAVQQQDYSGANTQLWRIQNIGASHFKISSVSNNKVFDISGASREIGAKLLNYEWSDDFNQKWHIIDCGNGHHRFVNVNTLGKTLEISGSSKNPGTDAVLCNFSYKDNQMFRIARVSEDFESGKSYMIVNVSSNKALEASGTDQLSSVIQSSQLQKPEQIWKLEDLYNGYFILTHSGTSSALGNSGKPEDLAPLTTSPSVKSSSQQWQFVSVGSSTYKIINRYSGKVIDNKDGSTSDGNPIIQYPDNASGSKNQQWKLIPVTSVSITEDKNPAPLQLHNLTSGNLELFDLHGRLIKSNSSSLSDVFRNRTTSRGLFIVRNLKEGKACKFYIKVE
ncbi:MAG: RICIN domain-containing protein [Chitinispirillaceae bacterium]|nr:RICIN domain-containing protein [Chitinispirillaceae bacterium]